MEERTLHIGNAVYLMELLTFYIVNDYPTDLVEFLLLED